MRTICDNANNISKATNLASTLAFSAIASGLGVFFPILLNQKLWKQFAFAIMDRFLTLYVLSPKSKVSTYLRTHLHLAKSQPSALYCLHLTSRSSRPCKKSFPKFPNKFLTHEPSFLPVWCLHPQTQTSPSHPCQPKKQYVRTTIY